MRSRRSHCDLEILSADGSRAVNALFVARRAAARELLQRKRSTPRHPVSVGLLLNSGVGVQMFQLLGSQEAVDSPENIVNLELTAGPALAAGIGYVLPGSPLDLSAKFTGGYLRGAHTEYVPLTFSLGVGMLAF